MRRLISHPEFSFLTAVLATVGMFTACSQSGDPEEASNPLPNASGPVGGSTAQAGASGTAGGGSTSLVPPDGAGGQTGGATGGGATGGGGAPGATGGGGVAGGGATGAAGNGNTDPSASVDTSSSDTGSGATTSGAPTEGLSGESESTDTSTTGSETTTGTGETTAAGGELALTGPWSAGDECTPMAKDACDDIPVENRATMIGGQNVMPTITWTAGPEETQSYAVVYQDLSNGFAHWALWNIPPDVLSVSPDAIPAEASQSALVGQAWFGSGSCDNVYQLSVYALSEGTIMPGGGQAHTAVRDQLDSDDGSLVLASDFARVTPKAPCGQ